MFWANVLLLLPLIGYAQLNQQSAKQLGEVTTFVNKINTFINDALIPLLFGVALLMFLYGMYNYYIAGGASDEARQKGHKLLIWSIVAFVLMVSIWGIVNMIAGDLFPKTEVPTTPKGPDLKPNK